MIKLIFGCGYLGIRVARNWRDAGCEVVALTRSAERAGAWAAAGIRPIVGDVLEPASLSGLPEADSVLFATGADRQDPQSSRAVYWGRIWPNVLAALPTACWRLIYISSTGVYGQADSRWVDEDTVCRPERAGGAACLAAERSLADSPWSQAERHPSLGGLYGPGRIPSRRDLLAGRPIAVPVAGYLNLIHIEDAARAVVAAADNAVGDGGLLPDRREPCPAA